MLGRATIGFSPTAQLNKTWFSYYCEICPPSEKIWTHCSKDLKNRIASALPAKFGLHGTFAYPSPSIEPTFLHAGTPFWVGRTTFDGKVGAGDRKRNLPNIHGVL